ncbi:uncharacterized protein K02A2.6-like [Bombyx mandarina]|uniref:RNA-directed DNA polymerase n=1 Tax=Bombyx mandarina TaxID=7092 RepID=A0A6J2KJN5_BOMMA|nr:uncharacterized protein K02A2.6-like [Bombyx mandarina]
MYVQAGLTFARAVELTESLRSARAAAAASAAAETVVTELVPQSAKVKCSVCGYSNHKAAECRFASYTCRKCNKKGHLRRMCKRINYVVTEENDEGDGDDGKICNIRSLRGEPLIEAVCVNGIRMNFEIDSGSAVTVMSHDTYNEHFKNIPLLSTNKKLLSYSGDVLGCAGRAQLLVEWRGRARQLDVYVVRDGGPPLLSRDFIAQFELQLAPVYKCATTRDTLKLIQEQYPAVFSDKLGQFNKYKVNLKLKESAHPIFFKPRPVAFALREKVEKEINRLVGLGVLRPVEHSDYASPIVPVLKRDGSIRICADYSVTINKQLVVEQHPLPTVNELFFKLYGGQKFTKLDLSMAYGQFCLDEESQKLTCINTHKGIFAYTRLVFGLASGPSIFQRAMDTVLAGLDGTLCLLDDVLITGRNDSEHLERLHQVLQRLQDAGFVLQKSKCQFFQDEINYLGSTINKEGLRKSPDKIKAILKAPAPTNVSQLRSFLGLVNYYRNFVPNASCILGPLYELLKKETKWRWSKLHDKAFNEIKKMLASDNVLAHFNPNANIILTVDASPNGLGAILSQVSSDGQEKPISFASRTLNDAEKRYSQIQKEATAIIFGVRRFHQYLYGRSNPFILRTDHKPLLSIFGPQRGIPEVSANRLQRYAIFLSGYNYVIEYVKSADNSADYLSRASLPDGAGACGGRGGGTRRGAGAVDVDAFDSASYVCFVVQGALPISVTELRNATSNDSILREVIKYIQNGWPKKIINAEVKPYYLCRLPLSVENGCVMRGHKVVIPGSLRHRILTELHSSHMGIVKTKAEARSRCWFPGLDDALENMISSCEVCMQLRPTPPRTPVCPWEYPPQPFYRVHLDFLGPLNCRMYLVLVDAYSKWLEVYEMASTTTSAV